MNDKHLCNYGVSETSFSEKKLVFMSPGKKKKVPKSSPSTAPKASAKKVTKAPTTPTKAPSAVPKAKVEKKTKKALTKTKSTVHRASMREKIEVGRKQEFKRLANCLSRWKISKLRRDQKINAKLWDPKTPAGLDRIKDEWDELEIYTGNDYFYEKLIFPQLEKSHNPPGLRNSPGYRAYQNPFKADGTAMEGLADKTDPAFAAAVDFFLAIKKIVASQDVKQIKIEEDIEKKGDEPILSTVARGAKKVVSDFTNAIKNRDYTTALTYLAGAYILYKAWQTIPKGAREKYGKWIWRGAAVYMGVVLTKKAFGIDLMKKMGFKKEYAEVEGTPLEAFKRLGVLSKPEDFSTLQDVTFVNIADLYEKYQKTNDPQKQFIDPNQFPLLAKRYNFEGLMPSDAQNVKLSDAKRKEYRDKGRSLYRVVAALEAAYNMKLYEKYGISFKEALNKPILKDSVVLDFANELAHYTSEIRKKESLVSLEGTTKTRDRLRTAFDSSKLDFRVNVGPKPLHYYGMVMGFPVVFIRDETEGVIRVFSRSYYDEEKKSPSKDFALASIPLKGKAGQSVKKLEKKIINKMKNDRDGLLTVFKRQSKSNITLHNPRYDPTKGGWVAKIEYKRKKLLKAKTGKMDVLIKVGENGRSLSITGFGRETFVYIKDVLDRQKLFGNLVLSQLVSQDGRGDRTDFRALQRLHMNDALSFRDKDTSDDEFTLAIKNVGSYKIKFDEKTGYSFVDKSMEQKLLKNYLFKKALKESVGENKQLEKSIDALKRMVADTPEAYLSHFIRQVPSWFTKATWDKWFRGVRLSDFTGSVAKNYTYALVDAQKGMVLSRFEVSVSKAKSFSDIGRHVNETLPKAINDFDKLTQKLSRVRDRHAAGGKKFTEEEYRHAILTDLMAIGCKSEDYKLWYKRFATGVTMGSSMDDLRAGRPLRTAKLLKVFAHWTAPINDGTTDGANLAAKKPAVVVKEPKKLSATATPADKTKYEEALKKYTLYKNSNACKEWEKAEKYRTHAAYAQHVADKIYFRMKRGDYPGPSSLAWGIVPYSEFEKNRTKYISNSELIDARPTWNLNKDYVGFDVYVEKLNKVTVFSKKDRKELEGLRKLEKNTTLDDPEKERLEELEKLLKKHKDEMDRLKKIEDLVLLPRKTITVIFPQDVGKRRQAILLLKKLIGKGTMDTIRKSDLEEQFYNKLHQATKRLEQKYGTRAKPLAFRNFRASYRMMYEPKPDKDFKKNGKMTIKHGHESGHLTPLLTGNRSNMNAAISYLHDQLSTSSPTTITKTHQENAIKMAVEHTIRSKILNHNKFGNFFDKTGPARWFRDVWRDFKDWLWGLKN